MYDIEKTLHNNEILKNFRDLELSKLCPNIQVRHFKAGEFIFSAKEQANYFYLLYSGEVSIHNDEGGKHTILAHHLFGDEGVIGIDFYLSSALAIEDSTVLVVSVNSIKNIASFRKYEHLFHNNFLGHINRSALISTDKDHDKKDIIGKRQHISNLVGWLMSFILPLVAIYSLLFLDQPPNQSQLLLIFVFLSAVVMWTFKLVPEFVPSIYLLLGTILLSLAPPSIALGGFYSDSFFLALSLSILGIIVSDSGLSYRVLLHLLKFRPNSRYWYHFALFISGVILTPIIPSANGRVGILYSLFEETVSLFKIKLRSLEYQRLIASTLGGVSLLSPIFLTSKSINLIAIGMLPPQEQYNFQFYYWFVASFVVGIVLVLFYIFFTWLLFRNQERHSIDMGTLVTQIKVLGKLTVEEVFAITAIVAFIVIILTVNYHNLQISWLAMLLIFCLFTLGVLKKSNFKYSVDWDFLMFLAALLSFSETMRYLELHIWMGQYTAWIEEAISRNFIEFSAILSILVILLRIVLPINITVILFASVLIPIATNTQINPWLIIFITLLMSETYTYNFSASYVVQFFSLINYQYTHWRLIVLQLIIYLVKFLAIVISIPFWQYLGLLE